MSNSQKPKNPADLLAGMLGLVKMLETAENGGDITEADIAEVEKVLGKCPDDVRADLLKSTNAPTQQEVPLSSDCIRVAKNPANFLSNAEEDAEVITCVEEFMDKWGATANLSPNFPLKVASSLFYVLGTSTSNDGGALQMHTLKIIDLVREQIVEDMLRRKGGVKCH